MASFGYTVDTQPLADAVHGVSNHVDGTTAAVVGMQSAVIAAENEAAEEICSNVNRGFHALILSQLSQKSAKAKSTLDAKLLELKYLATGLRRVKSQFQADFHRIADRYTRTFRNLDEALKARVYELDKGSTTLAIGEMAAIQSRNLTVGSRVPVLQLETLPVMQMLANGQVKLDSAAAIESMVTVVARTAELKRGTREIIEPRVVEERVVVAMPVAILESDDLKIADKAYRFYVPEAAGSCLDPDAVTGASSKVQESKKDLPWEAADPEQKALVREKCREMLAAGQADAREQEAFLKLFDASEWLALGGSPA